MLRLVQSLRAQDIIKDARVEAAMLKVDRKHYCRCENPYEDCPQAIGYGATISAPHMHAHALENLKNKLVNGAKVLDVGSGSGYLTACMAHMVAPHGKVYGVEHIPQLVRASQENLSRDCSELLETNIIEILQADGRVGLAEKAPFDVIHVGATAHELLKELINQLKIDGRMVIPVQRGERQMFELIEKISEDEVRKTNLLEVRYVPLTDASIQLRLA